MPGQAVEGSDYLWFQEPQEDAGDDADTLLLVFSHINVPPGRFAGRRSLSEHRGPVLYLNCPDNTWYLEGIPGWGDDVPSTTRALRAFIDTLGPKRVVAYGDSMGGWGALVFGDAIGADLSFVLSPEVELELAGSYFGKSAPRPETLAKRAPPFPGPAPARQVVAVFGGCDEGEMLQAAALRRLRSDVDLHVLPGLFHHVAPVVEAWMGLPAFLGPVLRGEAPPRTSPCALPDAELPMHQAVHAAWHSELSETEAAGLVPMLTSAWLTEGAPLRKAVVGDALARLFERAGLEEASTAFLLRLVSDHPDYLPLYHRLLRRLPRAKREPIRKQAEAAVKSTDPACFEQNSWRQAAVRTLRTVAATREQDGAPPALCLPTVDWALTLYPASPYLLYDRGNLLARLGRLDEAEVSYQASLAERPGTAAVHALKQLRRARAASGGAVSLGR